MVNLSQYEIFIETSLHNKLWRIISHHNTISHYQSTVKNALHHKYPQRSFTITALLENQRIFNNSNNPKNYSHQWNQLFFCSCTSLNKEYYP
ncbi:unnamed protein product (macronuclear) [Paramecium tetraurelia]|uniref:Uncharacterized protein n=1 Tax=Paramecium tetraurelia TaxID=5888 RepID=A0DMZ3_PARTE|nr:uncharacterized protein GSPATT00018615001 [Paramecium tetraurelia]CAK84410.1 unnamed protein product [Paramecium tetraurelia]|eukprot:XP_001451807.1 hypothetical protein (macronuclear) [Paramecium tetraurelia strain d4-2]